MLMVDRALMSGVERPRASNVVALEGLGLLATGSDGVGLEVEGPD